MGSACTSAPQGGDIASITPTPWGPLHPTRRGCAPGQTRIPHLVPAGDAGDTRGGRGVVLGAGQGHPWVLGESGCCGLIFHTPFPCGVWQRHPRTPAGHGQRIATYCPYSPYIPTQIPPQTPAVRPAAPAAPPRRPRRVRAPLRSRWLCLAARCRSRRASRPGCAGPNRMTRFGAPRLLPAPRRRQQIRSDGSRWRPRSLGRRRGHGQCQQLPKISLALGPELGSVSVSSA